MSEEKMLIKVCKHHGQYEVSEKDFNDKYLKINCPICIQENLNKPFSKPLAVNTLGPNNHFVVINKGFLDHRSKRTLRLKHTRIDKHGGWKDVKPESDPSNIYDTEKNLAFLHITQVWLPGDKVSIKMNGMRKKCQVVVDGDITDDTYYQDMKLGNVYKDITQTHRCFILEPLGKWKQLYTSDGSISSILKSRPNAVIIQK